MIPYIRRTVVLYTMSKRVLLTLHIKKTRIIELTIPDNKKMVRL